MILKFYTLSDDMFEKQTQPIAVSKQVHLENSENDIFDMATQTMAGATAAATSKAPAEENETGVFEADTQVVPETVVRAPAPSPAPKPQPLKRIPLVLTQSSQPANTPPWSMAAMMSTEAIENFEERKKAERESAKEKLKRKKYFIQNQMLN